MADNYLENKMEEHRRGGGCRRSPNAARRSSLLNYPFPERKCLVTGYISPLIEEFTANIASGGLRVALFPDAGSADKAGFLKEKYGVMLTDSLDIEKLAYNWRGIDAVIVGGGFVEEIVGKLGKASENPKCLIRPGVSVIGISELESGIEIRTSFLDTGLNPASGTVTVSGPVCMKDSVKFLKWILAPENHCFTGTHYKFLNNGQHYEK